MSPATDGQIALVFGSAALFLVGGGFSVARFWKPSNRLRLTAKSLAYFGICLALAALVWRSAARGIWLPLEDNFETMASLAILLAGFTLYVQRARPIPGLDWFLMPVVIVLDWLLMPPATRIGVNRAMLWLIFPLAYVTYSEVRGPFAHWYPYPFLDPRPHGVLHVVVYGIGIAVAFVLVSLAVAWSGDRLGDRLRGRRITL